MELKKIEDDFYPFMKVFLDDEFGVVTDDSWEGANQRKIYGLIRWDTEENDFTDWRGLCGTFSDCGGLHVIADYKFKFINDDGTPIKMKE